MMTLTAPGKGFGAYQAKTMSTLLLQFDGPVARLVIDHPQRRNAMTRAMWRTVPGLVAQARSTPGVRLLALQSSTAGAFCSGADISEFEATYATPDESRRSVAEIAEACDALATCELPTLALIDGVCVGGGMALVLSCDLRLASDRATFSITPAKLGLSYHPDDIARLVALCGPAIASEMLFGAQMWSAERCLQAGLLNRVIAAESFGSSCDELLQAMGRQSADAQRALKLGIRAAVSRDAGMHAAAADEFARMFASRDFVEGRTAFLDKRPADFPSHRTSASAP